MSSERPKITIPHSWAIEDWPDTVFPNSATRGRYLVRVHRADLLNAGALVRVGRELVIIGQPYDRWLRSKAENVANYEIPPNREESEDDANQTALRESQP